MTDLLREVVEKHFPNATEQVLHEVRTAIATQVRNNCTPSSEAYKAGGDTLIYAVADWIADPPIWVTR